MRAPSGRIVKFADGSSQGYILLEAMLAVAVASAGLVAVLAAFRLSAAGVQRARDTAVATWLAEQTMAELRVVPLQSIGTHEGAFEGDLERYRWRTIIRPVEGQTFYTVIVEVWWPDQGRERAVSLVSLLPSRPFGGGQ
jgi:type II secretion system protein I